jgi:cytochrome b
VGQGYARFDTFVPSRERFREHMAAMMARTIPADSGHNPLGALMIYLVFLLVAVLTVTGWMHEEIDALFGNDLLQEIHEVAAHTLWICALLHVAAVFLVQYVGRIDLVRPMITGRRKPRI